MSKDIHGKSYPPEFNEMNSCALITGAGRRVGRAIALYLAARGWDIVLHMCHSDPAPIVNELHALKVKTHVIKASLHQGNCHEVIKEAFAHGAVGALINNASVFGIADDEKSFADNMNIHVDVPFFLSQSFEKILPATDKGCIIHVTDQRVFNATPYFLSYSVSKLAMSAMTERMALAFAPRVRVNEVAPGPIFPHEGQNPEVFKAQCRRMPLRHGAHPDDVAAAVYFLLTHDAITGARLPVDGGQHLGWANP